MVHPKPSIYLLLMALRYNIHFCKKKTTPLNGTLPTLFAQPFSSIIKCIAKKEANFNLTCWWFHWVSLQVMQSAREKLALVQFPSSWVLILTGGHSTLRADLNKKIVLIEKDYQSMKGYPITLCPESSENIPILLQEADLYFSNQNDLRNPKMGSKQSIPCATEWVFFQITFFGTKNHQKNDIFEL